MTMIVEDGSVVPNANSYQTEAAFLSYWADRNVTVTNSTAEIEAALIISTQYVDQKNRFRGSIVDSTQSLSWPRKNAKDCENVLIASDSIPNELKNAINEYAFRQLSSPISTDPSNGGEINYKREKLGPMEEETHYTENTSTSINRYPLADNYLRCLIIGSPFGNLASISRC